MSFVAASPLTKSFTCPHCRVITRQNKWGYDLTGPSRPYDEYEVEKATLQLSCCEYCGKVCIWCEGVYIFPNNGNAPQANPDMPEEVAVDFEEAAAIYMISPRGAAALLRLALQKLMIHLDQPGKNINDDIKALVAKGLPLQVQQALDIVRVTGNNAVHPGMLDANDIVTAEQLFPLLNLIVEYQISLPARLTEMFDALPEGARAGIQQRDGRK
ncbi:DUF4145 domain-containing protein [Pseudomonas fragi]|uniref:DUF4145 domain-containing protein n=1 Tax=Pseudomonas fragi TaxID=296 RepID=UPI001472F112|nr:DUF4145 domain-containing protein [Pseudomonas fragi]NNB15951.1 DUF4145 domain-containing protein [Pseudomonas fragi]NNB18461.1 DUF4145 domain-containing protein [Pseudomonas fragi]